MKQPNLENHIRAAIYKYPSLYRDIDYEKSRLIVLGHIFLSYGTALEWHPDGYLTYLDHDNEEGYAELNEMETLPEGFFEKKLWYVDIPEECKDDMEKDLEGKFFYWNGRHYNGSVCCVFEADEKRAKELTLKYDKDENEYSRKSYAKEMAEILGKDVIDMIHPFEAECHARQHRGKPTPDHLKKLYEKTYVDGYSPYPMCHYSPMAEMGKKRVNSLHIDNFDITTVLPDWAKGAVDIARYTLAWYKNEGNHKFDHYYPDGKPNKFYEEDPEKFRKNCDGTHGGVVFTDEMTIEEYTWAAWEHHLAKQMGYCEKVIELYG